MKINKAFIKENWIVLLIALLSILYALYTGPYSFTSLFINAFLAFLTLGVLMILLILWKFSLPIVVVLIFDKFLTENPFVTAVFVYLCVCIVLYWLSKKDAANVVIKLGRYNIQERSHGLRDVLKNAFIVSIVLFISAKALIFLLDELAGGSGSNLECSVRGCR